MMTNDTKIEESMKAIKSILLGYVLGDNPGVMELVHPESIWRFPGDPRILPWAGEHRGCDFEVFMEAVKDSLDFLEHTPHTLLPIDETRVVVMSRDHCRVKATGKVFFQDLVAIATIRDGLLYGWHEHGDTAVMHAAFED